MQLVRIALNGAALQVQLPPNGAQLLFAANLIHFQSSKPQHTSEWQSARLSMTQINSLHS